MPPAHSLPKVLARDLTESGFYWVADPTSKVLAVRHVWKQVGKGGWGYVDLGFQVGEDDIGRVKRQWVKLERHQVLRGPIPQPV